MDTLEAVNLILRRIGESPVTSVDGQYPTLAIALPALAEARITVLSEGYWFNTFYEHVLQPDVNGRIVVPADTLKFFPEDAKFAFLGDSVVLQDNGSPVVGEPVKGRMIIDRDFEKLPELARYAIAYHAAYDTYLSDIGPDATLQELDMKRQMYAQQLGGDHTISRKHNTRTKKQQQRLRRALWT